MPDIRLLFPRELMCLSVKVRCLNVWLNTCEPLQLHPSSEPPFGCDPTYLCRGGAWHDSGGVLANGVDGEMDVGKIGRAGDQEIEE